VTYLGDGLVLDRISDKLCRSSMSTELLDKERLLEVTLLRPPLAGLVSFRRP
jgi:hypothetical protein